MILINPRREVELVTRLRIDMQGFYRLRLINKFSGKCRVDTGWFPNILLTNGLNQMADFDFMTHCQVGSDNTEPNAAQSALISHVDGTNTITSTSSGAASSSPYYGWKRKIFRFAAGPIGGQALNEVGVGWATSGSTLISRAKLLDPITKLETTINPLADELLEVTYELRYYAPTVDSTGITVTLQGTIYDVTTRACKVTNTEFWGDIIGTKIGVVASTTKWVAWTGNIGAVTGEPTGSSAATGTSNQTNSPYVGGNTLQVNCPVSSSQWNIGGIRSIVFSTYAGCYQSEFSSNPGGNTIPKTSNEQMNMAWDISWGQYTAP